MASDTQRTRFRRNVGDPGGASPMFTDDEIDDMFTEAGELYPSGSDDLHLTYATLKGWEARIANAVIDVSYTQNATSQSASDKARAMKQMVDFWQRKLDKALQSSEPAIGWVSPKVFPTVIKDLPDA